ncbi:DEAD/DEAH box helicase [Nocardioides mangrovicus]|uniref:DEAD/DEAH box helicase n=1 Tax=Nocardioides mangrovicus TaxID=2478913 RepID=A0A3L8NZE0_9ACTN|nr:DEAD/DEAH box helicase [Nocardioides mangrovicus]RLV48284.1 DEAD/DEAH box helicase [Nocardioides mangrovicus]
MRAVPGGAAALLERLAALPGREGRLVHTEVRPARLAQHAAWPTWLDPLLREALTHRGVSSPWTHQVEAAEAAHRGEHVVLSTGTASGKSLGYLMPGLTDVRLARGSRGQRGGAVLYLSPTKALAQDQLAALRALGADGGLDVRATTHDGDSTPEERAWTRDHAEYVLTNPDMLHRSLLPTHDRWHGLLRSLRYVVVDECHHYRGVFGAHVAQVLRRLRRVCEHHGSSPTFVLASATVADPAAAGTRLTGLPVTAVTEDGSPRGELVLGLWQPPVVSHEGELGAPLRRPTGAELADLLTDLVVAGVRSLAFVRSRRGVETVALGARHRLAEVSPGLEQTVAAYRGGYLPEERRELERALREGRLLGVAATNALELGIDVSGLDAVLLGGFPGTRSALWQQLGRAGRSGEEALGMLVARDDPLDTYLVAHPEALLHAPVEASVFDPTNPYVLGPHLCAAAAEVPLTTAGLDLFGPSAHEAVDQLTAAGLLRRRPAGWFWTDRRRACDLTDIRSAGGRQVRLVEQGSGRVLGTVDPDAAHGTVHAGAVYLHQGESWVVDELDLDDAVAVAHREDPGWSTSAREVTDIAIGEELRHQDWGLARLSFGTVRVAHQVVSYQRRRVPGGEVLDEQPLELPERVLDTCAVWWTVSDDQLAGVLETDELPGAAHAAEHAAIGLLPLFATCDRWDIGGVSTAHHPDTGRLTVFVHDGHPGGAGFAERGYEVARDWLRATRDAIEGCHCERGCPSCVQSPKCGNGNHPLDKEAAVRLLGVLLAEPRA